MTDNGQLHRKNPIFGKVPEALFHDLSITDGAVRLYAHLHWRYGRTQRAFEKQSTIGNWLGIGERAVRDRILELEAANWVIVLQRRTYGSKTALSNKYHVFEDKQDALDFRSSPPPLEPNETIREITTSAVRKPRTGTGGKPSHKPKSSGTQVPDVNGYSGSDGEAGVNGYSGSEYLEALKVLNQTHSVVAPKSATSRPSNLTPQRTAELQAQGEALAQRIAETPSPTFDDFTSSASGMTNADTRKQPFEALKDAVTSVWGWENGGLVANIAKMLAGKFKPGEKATDYKLYQFDTAPVSADELEAWAEWYQRTHPRLSLAQKPDAIAKSVGEYRAALSSGTTSGGFNYQTAFTFVGD